MKIEGKVSELNVPFEKKGKSLPLPYSILAYIVEKKIASTKVKKSKW